MGATGSTGSIIADSLLIAFSFSSEECSLADVKLHKIATSNVGNYAAQRFLHLDFSGNKRASCLASATRP